MTNPIDASVLRSRLAILLFVLLCGTGALCSLAQVRHWGNELSVVDTFSEANALREVRNFLDDGLMKYQGLGMVYRADMYPGQGFSGSPADRIHGVTAEGVYTHYPPGPEYLLYVSARVLGMDPVSRLRLVPICVGWAAVLFLGFAVRRRFGGAVGWMVMGACAITPGVTDGFVGLHYQGYAAALLMVEIGLCLGGRASLAPMGLVGFLQGWLSFDYVFLVTFVPLALECALPRIDRDHQPRMQLALLRAVLAGGGFTAALAIHFIQVSAYWGSAALAVRDFAGAAAHRAGADMVNGTMGYLAQAAANLKIYFHGLHPLNTSLSLPDTVTPETWTMFRFLGLSLGPWWLLVTVVLMAWDMIRPSPEIAALRKDWHFVCLTGAATSSIWLVTMVNHGIVHVHFLYRHLFFAFFLIVLFAAVRIAKHRELAAVHGGQHAAAAGT